MILCFLFCISLITDIFKNHFTYFSAFWGFFFYVSLCILIIGLLFFVNVDDFQEFLVYLIYEEISRVDLDIEICSSTLPHLLRNPLNLLLNRNTYSDVKQSSLPYSLYFLKLVYKVLPRLIS